VLMQFSIETELGWLGISIISNQLCNLDFLDSPPTHPEKPNGYAITVAEQLVEYFAKKRQSFSLSLNPSGTEFQRLVWAEIQKFPFGEVITYSDIARNIDRPTSMRAVGNAVGANPIPVIIPCHRVVAKNGIGGFSGGLWRKEILLNIENYY